MPSPPEAGDIPPEDRDPAGIGGPAEPEPGGASEPEDREAHGTARPEDRESHGTAGPEERDPRRDPAPGSPEDALRRIEQRLDRASEAAERLMAQVAGEAVRASRAPGAGNPGGGAGNPPGGGAGTPGGGGGPGAPGGGGGAGAPGGGGAGTPGGGGAAGAPGGGGAGPPPSPPPAGWQAAEDPARGSTSELDPFVALIQAVRDLIPPDLQERLIAALREVLLALRALIDWYLERLDRRRAQGVEVQDIPIL